MNPPASDFVSKLGAWLLVGAGSVGALAMLAARLGWVPGAAAFRIVLVATLVASIALIAALIGLWRTRARRRTGRGLAATSVLVGAVWVLAVLTRAFAGIGAPVINDVTTDLDNPPSFSAEGAASKAAVAAQRSLEYPTQAFAALQREHYPDLGSVQLATDTAQAAARARAAMQTLGWQETLASLDGAHIEATATSALFRFVDDIVVRIRAGHSGVIVDVRSRSRVGKSDLGANAARIRAFVAAL